MKIRRILGVLLAVVLLLGLTACGGNTSLRGHLYENAVTIDGEKIPSGIYLAVQYNAYNEAKGIIDTENLDSDEPVTDIFKHEIEGEKTYDWIHNRTLENLKKYVLVSRECEEREIFLNDENSSNLQESLGYFTSSEEKYARNGISETSLKAVMVNSMLETQLFDEMYKENSDLIVSDSELKKEYAEQNANIRYLMMPVSAMDEKSTDYTEDVTKMAQDMQKELENGADFDAVAADGLEKVYTLLGREFDDESVQNSISSSYISYKPDTTETYSEKFLKTLKSQKVGEFGIYNMETILLLYEKQPVFESDEDFDEMRDTIIQSLYKTEFNDYLSDIYDKYDVKMAFGAERFFSAKKIVTT